MSSRLPQIVLYLKSGWKPYGFLLIVLATTYAVLALRGFTFGFYGDVVAYQFHYRFEGVFGGMNWLVTEHWQRHLLGGLFSAPLHVLVPDRYDLWYALELFIHFAAGTVVFLLIDTLQSGQRRWLAFAIALYFVFDTLQTPSNIEFATSSHRKTSLILSILSLWAYLRFVRDNRRTLGWFIFNIVTFMLAMMIYEHAFFFLLLHPVIAYVEDRRSGEFAWNRRYLSLTIRDSLFHVIVVLIYVYMLLTLFSGGNKNLQLSPSHLLSQFSLGFHLLLSPLAIIERLSTAVSLSQVWFVPALSILSALFFGLWIRYDRDVSERASWSPLWIALLGLGIILLNIANTSPTIWRYSQNVRLIYFSSVGSGMIIFGALAWLVERYSGTGILAFAAAAALFLAPGASLLFEHQAVHLALDRVSNRAFQAIYDGIPAFTEDAEPYLLLISDVHPEKELAMHPRDINFPRVFALHYGVEGFAADAVIFSDNNSNSVAKIQLRDEGILSPLQPHVLVDYNRVVIVAYDSRNNSATILDRLPADVLQRGNFDIMTDVTVETNWSLLP